jgi:hypothetical protein
MSRKENCRDNVCAESFFKTIKQDLETLDGRHSALDYNAPMCLTQTKQLDAVYLTGGSPSLASCKRLHPRG